jgi:CheY-like chemotaxis protein
LTGRPRKRKRIVIVDDSHAFGNLWARIIRERFGEAVAVETYAHPYDAIPKIDGSIDLLIADLEIPGMDGERFVDLARDRGVLPQRIILTSSLPAEELHQRFKLGEAIAVINKTEPKQQEAFLMILDSLMRH